jgi:hypothetical protein
MGDSDLQFLFACSWTEISFLLFLKVPVNVVFCSKKKKFCYWITTIPVVSNKVSICSYIITYQFIPNVCRLI